MENKETQEQVIEVHGLDDLDNLDEEQDDSISEQISTQDINEIVANVPVEIEVIDSEGASHILKIYSSTINKMVMVDQAIESLEKVGSEDIEMEDDDDIDNYVRRLRERTRNIFDRMIDVLFLIINERPKKPLYDKEWIKENVNITDEDGAGHLIMDAYNYKSSAEKVLSLVKKMLVSKKFA